MPLGETPITSEQMPAPKGIGHKDAVISITSRWFCAGVVLDGSGHVYRCAPILGYMKGWSWERFFATRAFGAVAESRDEIGLLATSAKAARAILAKRLPGNRCARPGANRISWQPFQVLPALPRFAAGAFLNAVDDARRSQCDGVFARLHILRC